MAVARRAPQGNAPDRAPVALIRIDVINHYSLQRPEHYAAWRAQALPGFVFAVKGSRRRAAAGAAPVRAGRK